MAGVRIGGQAVMEGVMMKNDDKYAVAVRKPDKEIEVEITEYKPFGSKASILRFPIIRGVVNFLESMVIGMKTLMYSASFYDEEQDEPKKKNKKEKDQKTTENNKEKSDNKKSEKDESGAEVFWTIAISLVIAIGLFMLLPAFVASLLEKYIESRILISIIEGVIRLLIFFIYIIAISLMEDIKRTYMYHGAEHKTINCLEHGLELTVENVMKQSRFHKRCGTSFLFIVMIVSIVIFLFINTNVLWLKMLLRVLLVPVVAGISYEFIRFAGKSDSFIANVLSKPGLLVQRFTTKEPTEDMVEVAIKSVEAVLDWRAYLEEERSKK